VEKIETYSQQETFERDGLSFSCVQYYQRDQEGMDFVDGETMNKNLLIRQDAYREKAGLLNSEDIKAIRKIYHLSQKDFGQILGLGQIDIARYETKAVQTRSINDLLLRSREDPLWFYGKYCSFAPQMTLDKRMEVAKAIEAYSSSKGIKEIACKNAIDSAYLPYRSRPEMRGNQDLSLPAVISIINLASAQGIKLYKTKLAKLLFYCDFLSQKRTGKGLTGIVYSHASYGALPVAYDALLSYPGIQVEEAVVYPEEDVECLSSLVKTKGKNSLNQEQTELVKSVLNALGGLSSSQISTRMHQENAYRLTKSGQIISYQFAKDLQGF
jgi:DNA-binding transcriptional regulator YiaG